MVTVSVKIPDIVGKAGKMLPTMTDIHSLAIQARNIIRKRTEKGIDINGNEFVDYSEQYKKYRVKKGRNASPVSLVFTNAMLGSLGSEKEENKGIEKIPNGYKIYIADAERRAIGSYHNEGAGRLPKREWFGLSETEINELVRLLVAKLKKRAGI